MKTSFQSLLIQDDLISLQGLCLGSRKSPVQNQLGPQEFMTCLDICEGVWTSWRSSTSSSERHKFALEQGTNPHPPQLAPWCLKGQPLLTVLKPALCQCMNKGNLNFNIQALCLLHPYPGSLLTSYRGFYTVTTSTAISKAEQQRFPIPPLYRATRHNKGNTVPHGTGCVKRLKSE